VVISKTSAPADRADRWFRSGSRPGAVRRATLRFVVFGWSVAALAGCQPGRASSPETTASTSDRSALDRVHAADAPCRNERADERGTAVPAGDISVDDRVAEWPRAAPAVNDRRPHLRTTSR
jgi:hypothetical protein